MAAYFSLAFALVTFVLGVAIYRAMRTEFSRELDQRIVVERDALLRESSLDHGRLGEAVEGRSEHGGQDMFYAITNARGARVAGSFVGKAPAIGWSQVSFRDEEGVMDNARAVTTPVRDGEFLVVGADPETIERLDHKMVPLFAQVFGAMAVVGVAGGFLMSAALRRRIDAITGTAEAIIGGDLSRRMSISRSHDEFDRLSATLNQMLDRIDGLMSNLRQVSSDIAHDLRTPLTRLRQKLDLADASRQDVTALQGALDEAGAHADELLTLFTAILSISEVEAGGAKLRVRPLDLSALVTDIAESYGPAAEDSDRKLVCSIESGVVIDGQRELIAQLLVNLLDNALRHTPPTSEISVALTSSAEEAVLTVADNGPGITPEDRDRVFERFVRLERSRTTPGHGLGLRLVAAIAAAHRATITLEDNHPGVRMMITFKRSSQ